jgi:apolipoprotein N-acyltransferase
MQSRGWHFGLAILSAVLLILIFPPLRWTWLAPIVLAPILVACAKESSAKWRFLFGWAAGFVYWWGLCPWIQFVLEVHGGMGKWGGWGTFVLFGLYKGLYLAVFAALTGYVINRRWTMPAVAALWVGLERLHAYSGFAWLQLGNAGIDMPLPMRLAPITGVYGLSFVFAMLGCAVALVILRRSRYQLLWLAALPGLILLPRGARPMPPAEKILAVQPNIDTEAQWTDEFLATTERKLATLSRAHGVSLIIWPEVPAPFYSNNPTFHAFAASIARTSETHFLFGAVAFNGEQAPLNSAVMLDPNGRDVDRYDKINLVPFGEFIPPPFGFVNRITHEVGDFASGKRIVVFPVRDRRVSAFICYESAFPELVSGFVRSGAEVLINISNDGYFGHSKAHAQHLEITRMRAAENRRWILRVTNDGITATINPRGRVVDQLVPFEQTAALLPFGYEKEMTFYTRHGDWFAWGCLVASLMLVGVSRI